MAFQESAVFYVVRATHDKYADPHWLRKSGRDGKGVWKITDQFRYAEQMDLGRAKTALKSTGVKRLKKKGLVFQIFKVESELTFQKVFPLSPLEKLAQQATG